MTHGAHGPIYAKPGIVFDQPMARFNAFTSRTYEGRGKKRPDLVEIPPSERWKSGGRTQQGTKAISSDVRFFSFPMLTGPLSFYPSVGFSFFESLPRIRAAPPHPRCLDFGELCGAFSCGGER